MALADDVLGCEARTDLLDTDEQLAPLDPPPCPITIAWSARDRVLPLEVNGARARELIPGARFIVLEGVGHLPMLDDPDLVARTIRGVGVRLPRLSRRGPPHGFVEPCEALVAGGEQRLQRLPHGVDVERRGAHHRLDVGPVAGAVEHRLEAASSTGPSTGMRVSAKGTVLRLRAASACRGS